MHKYSPFKLARHEFYVPFFLVTIDTLFTFVLQKYSLFLEIIIIIIYALSLGDINKLFGERTISESQYRERFVRFTSDGYYLDPWTLLAPLKKDESMRTQTLVENFNVTNLRLFVLVKRHFWKILLLKTDWWLLFKNIKTKKLYIFAGETPKQIPNAVHWCK